MIAFNAAETPSNNEVAGSVLARHVRTALIFAALHDAHDMSHMKDDIDRAFHDEQL